MNKRILQIALLTMGCLATQAQDPFFEATDYIGALSSDESKDWTKTGWTNFDPKNTNYPSPDELTTLAAGNTVKDITTAVTLDASKTYLLSGIIAIKDGGSLTIPAGTVIRALKDVNAGTGTSNYGIIIVERGGKIFVNGTAQAPVVITSNAPVGSRERGDVGGLVLLGKAVNNQGSDIQLEGFNKLSGYLAGDGGKFGGNTDNDNSGVLKYLRVEFAGIALDVNKEINAITFASVGNGTTVDYVQTSYSNDDSYEWFGGTVNAKHLIAFSGTDDDFDTDFGFRGKLQFGIGLKNPNYYDLTYADQSGASTSEGFESDNDANGSTNTPYTSAIFSNFTMVGPISLDSTYSNTSRATTKNAFRRGARLRRNTKQSIINTIFMGYRNFIMLDGTAAMANYGATTSGLSFRTDSAFLYSNIFYSTTATAQFSSSSKSANGLAEIANTNVTNSNPVVADTSVNGPRLRAVDSWLRDARNKELINTATWGNGHLLIDPQNLTNPNFRPVSALVGVTDYTYVANLDGVYPNPVASNETLNIAKEATSYSLVSTSGNEIKSGIDTKVDLTGVQKGLYLLKVGKNSTKIVVE